MKRYIKRILDKLKELYSTYEQYCWHNKSKNINIKIVIEDNNICYYLEDDKNNIIDEFIMNFTKQQQNIYYYLSVKIFASLLNDIPIYNDENVYYNTFYRPHLKIIINDENIIKIINSIPTEENKTNITDTNPTIKKLYKKIPLWDHNKARVTTIAERIKLTKKLTDGLE